MAKVTKILANSKLVKKLKVAAYCRVSTLSDDQQDSLETQKDHYTCYIQTNLDWEFVGLYFDEGVSGTKIEKRLGLQRLISDCKKKKVDLILTKSISRFARNTMDCLELIRKLSGLGVAIYFEKEQINTLSMGDELMLSVLSSLAESESESISSNNKWAIKNRFKSGTYTISTPPFGYENVDGRMVINPEEGPIVKWIFESILNGVSNADIVRELNSKGIKSKRGKTWTATTIRNIVKNEKYKGEALFQKTYTDVWYKRHRNTGTEDRYLIKAHHEPLVTEEVFDKVNEIIRQRGLAKGNVQDKVDYQNRYPFSGKIKCSECGASFKRRRHYIPRGEYIAWTCTNHIEGKHRCSMKFIKDSEIRVALQTMMNKLKFGEDDLLTPLIEALNEVDKMRGLDELRKIDMDIRNIQDQKNFLMNLRTKDLITPAQYTQEVNALLVKESSLKSGREIILSEEYGERDHIEQLQELVKDLDNQDTDLIFENHVEKMTVLSRDRVLIELKCGLSLEERLVI